MKEPEIEIPNLFREITEEEKVSTKKGGYSPTPYDDVFRSMIAVCSRFLIPLVNEVFGKKYTGDEEVALYQNEILVNESGSTQRKIITDSRFAIISEQTELFHIECQSSKDNTILIRMFDYGSQTALSNAVIEGDQMVVEFPHAAVLYLRSSGHTPDFLQVCIKAEGNSMKYKIPVVKLRKYEWETILQKKLFFLLPFQIFNDESKFKKCNKDKEALQKLEQKYYQIAQDLEQLEQNGTITAVEKRHTLEMSYKVLDNIAVKYKNVVEGVGRFMSGTVLESEASLILKQGIERGIEQGIERGIEQGRKEGRAEERGRFIQDAVKKCHTKLKYDKSNTMKFLMMMHDLEEVEAAQYVDKFWEE